MGDRSERVQAILDLQPDDFEEAVANLLEAASTSQMERFRALLAEETPTRIEEAGLALLKAGKAYAKDSRGGALGDLQSAASDYGAALHDAGWL